MSDATMTALKAWQKIWKKVAIAGDVWLEKGFYVIVFVLRSVLVAMVYLYSKADSTTPRRFFLWKDRDKFHKFPCDFILMNVSVFNLLFHPFPSFFPSLLPWFWVPLFSSPLPSFIPFPLISFSQAWMLVGNNEYLPKTLLHFPLGFINFTFIDPSFLFILNLNQCILPYSLIFAYL